MERLKWPSTVWSPQKQWTKSSESGSDSYGSDSSSSESYEGSDGEASKGSADEGSNEEKNGEEDDGNNGDPSSQEAEIDDEEEGGSVEDVGKVVRGEDWAGNLPSLVDAMVAQGGDGGGEEGMGVGEDAGVEPIVESQEPVKEV